MRVLATLLASAALIAAPAEAQIANTQTQANDTYGGLRLTVDEAVDVGGTAIAGGNAVTIVGEQADIDLRSTQTSSATAAADAQAEVNTAHGVVSIYAASVANGLTTSAIDGNTSASAAQFSSGDTDAITQTRIGQADAAASSASAGANVASLVSENGDLSLALHQESTGAVSANTDAEHCCVNTAAVADAIASANNITAAGYTTTMLSNTSQVSNGPSVTAHSELYAGYAVDAIGNATANGNALNLDNQFGYANAAAAQENSSDVDAQSYVTLGGDWWGTASAGAYGVGNSAALYNVGSDTVFDVTQNNTGGVSADAAVAGLGGDAALASSAAYGNVITASLCGYCDTSTPGLTASGSQTNSGPVTSTAVINTPYARTVAGTATAIGNAATYQVQGQN